MVIITISTDSTDSNDDSLPNGGREKGPGCLYPSTTPNPPTNIVGFRGFDSIIMLFLRGGIPWPIGDFPETLSQAMLVGVMLVGRLGVPGKERMGSALMGAVQISCFSTEGLLGYSH